MEPTRYRSNGSRFVSPIAILFFSALLFGVIAGSASAMKIVINTPGKDNMTPVTGMIVESARTENPITADVTVTAHVNGQPFASGMTASTVDAFNNLPTGAVRIEGAPADIAAKDLVDMDNELRILSVKTMLFDDALRQICNAVR